MFQSLIFAIERRSIWGVGVGWIALESFVRVFTTLETFLLVAEEGDGKRDEDATG